MSLPVNVSVLGIMQGVQEQVNGAEDTGRCILTHKHTHHHCINLGCLRNEAKNILEYESRSNMVLTKKSSVNLLT